MTRARDGLIWLPPAAVFRVGREGTEPQVAGSDWDSVWAAGAQPTACFYSRGC
nr:hypothetical protein [Oceanococcus sp. HetDA_MAG_MS8]